MKIKQVRELSDVTRFYEVSGVPPVETARGDMITPAKVEVQFKNGTWLRTGISDGRAGVEFTAGGRRKPPAWTRRLERY